MHTPQQIRTRLANAHHPALALLTAVTLAPAAVAQDMVKCLNTDGNRQLIRACFIDHGRPLLAASTEAPETIATAVDAACSGPKAAMTRQLMGCMRIDQALDVVEQYAASLRASVIVAVVQERAGLPKPQR
jgi:hypothetical protein